MQSHMISKSSHSEVLGYSHLVAHDTAFSSTVLTMVSASLHVILMFRDDLNSGNATSGVDTKIDHQKLPNSQPKGSYKV